jgi:hypothetical protein
MTTKQKAIRLFKPKVERVERGKPACTSGELFGVQKGKSITYFPRFLDAVVHKHEIKGERVFCTKVVTKLS